MGITWVATEGIAQGYDDGRFKPTTAVSRQALAAFLHRYDTRFGPSQPAARGARPAATHDDHDTATDNHDDGEPEATEPG